jgi:hypothetical protein
VSKGEKIFDYWFRFCKTVFTMTSHKSQTQNKKIITQLSVADVATASIGDVTSETYEVHCSGNSAYRESVDTFHGALDIVRKMKEDADDEVTITIVRVVDTVIRQFVVGANIALTKR